MPSTPDPIAIRILICFAALTFMCKLNLPSFDTGYYLIERWSYHGAFSGSCLAPSERMPSWDLIEIFAHYYL